MRAAQTLTWLEDFAKRLPQQDRRVGAGHLRPGTGRLRTAARDVLLDGAHPTQLNR